MQMQFPFFLCSESSDVCLYSSVPQNHTESVLKILAGVLICVVNEIMEMN